MAKKKSKKGNQRSIIILFLIILITIIGYKGLDIYGDIFKSNFQTKEKQVDFHIPTGTNFEQLIQLFIQDDLLKNEKSFRWISAKKHFTQVKPGRYVLKNGLSNNELVNILRSGRQTPVDVSFNHIRFNKDFAGIIARQLETDSIELLRLLNDSDFLKEFGVNKQTVSALFIPNTYEFYWNTGAEQFIRRMYREYNSFWNKDRENKQKATGLSKIEIITLASIVDEETFMDDEMPRIAGVYMNRLKIRMRLGADPTLKFALGNFNVKRILNADRKIDSPYNTYTHYGLPPGPISYPTIAAIDAVLNFEKHEFLYFCAKSDFSGYHEYAKTYKEHTNNANKYHAALNKRRIYR